jgi:hypothetical protein
MVELTRLMASQAAQAYDFAGKRVADIAGYTFIEAQIG